MDPLSITTSCICVLGAIGKTAVAITAFVKSCREARGDLAEINRELSDLRMVLELLRDDSDVQNAKILPHTLQQQILSLLDKCAEVLAKIEIILAKQTGHIGEVRWVVKSKNDVANLRQSLEGYRTALSLALDLVTVVLAKEIIVDTRAIRHDTADIKQDTSRILSEIDRLRTRTALEGGIEQRRGSKGLILRRYLDDLTTYAETVSEDIDYQNDYDVPMKELGEGDFISLDDSLPESQLPRLSIGGRSTHQMDIARIRRDSYETDRQRERRESERRIISERGRVSTSPPDSPDTDYRVSNTQTTGPSTKERVNGPKPFNLEAGLRPVGIIDDDASEGETTSDGSMYTCPSVGATGSSSNIEQDKRVEAPPNEQLDLNPSESSLAGSTLQSDHRQSHSNYAFSYRSTFGSSDRHRDDVVQIAISHVSKIMATRHRNGLIKIWPSETVEASAQSSRGTRVTEPLNVLTLGVKTRFRTKRPSTVKHLAFSDDAYLVVDVFRGSRPTIELWDWKSNLMVSDVASQTHEGWNDSTTGIHARLTQHKFQFYNKGLDGFQEIRSLYFDAKIPYAIPSTKQVFEFCRNPAVMDIAMAVTNVMCSAPMLAIIKNDPQDTIAKHAGFAQLNDAIPKGVASENATVWSIWLKQDSSSWYILTWDILSSDLGLTEIIEPPPEDCRLSPDGRFLVAWYRSTFVVLEGRSGAHICSYSFPSIPLEETPKIKAAGFSQNSEILVVGLSKGWGQVFQRGKTTPSVIARAN